MGIAGDHFYLGISLYYNTGYDPSAGCHSFEELVSGVSFTGS